MGITRSALAQFTSDVDGPAESFLANLAMRLILSLTLSLAAAASAGSVLATGQDTFLYDCFCRNNDNVQNGTSTSSCCKVTTGKAIEDGVSSPTILGSCALLTNVASFPILIASRLQHRLRSQECRIHQRLRRT